MSTAAKLVYLVDIEQRGQAEDDYGREREAWAPFAAAVPADIEDISGRQYVAAQANRNSVTTKITVRALPGIKAQMRVVHQLEDGSRDIFDIESVLRRGAFLELMAAKEVQ